MANIDAPDPGYCGAEEAKEYLNQKISGKTVRLEFFGRDSFNRPLVYVYIDKELVNETMLREGLADYYIGEGDKLVREQLKIVTQEARTKEKGVHGSTCTQKTPESPKCVIKGNLGGDNDSEKIYHFPGCRDYDKILLEKFRGEQWFCSEKEAIAAGFVKAKTCYDKSFKPNL